MIGEQPGTCRLVGSHRAANDSLKRLPINYRFGINAEAIRILTLARVCRTLAGLNNLSTEVSGTINHGGIGRWHQGGIFLALYRGSVDAVGKRSLLDGLYECKLTLLIG
jgi:hypothetical protein